MGDKPKVVCPDCGGSFQNLGNHRRYSTTCPGGEAQQAAPPAAEGPAPVDPDAPIFPEDQAAIDARLKAIEFANSTSEAPAIFHGMEAESQESPGEISHLPEAEKLRTPQPEPAPEPPPPASPQLTPEQTTTLTMMGEMGKQMGAQIMEAVGQQFQREREATQAQINNVADQVIQKLKAVSQEDAAALSAEQYQPDVNGNGNGGGNGQGVPLQGQVLPAGGMPPWLSGILGMPAIQSMIAKWMGGAMGAPVGQTAELDAMVKGFEKMSSYIDIFETFKMKPWTEGYQFAAANILNQTRMGIDAEVAAKNTLNETPIVKEMPKAQPATPPAPAPAPAPTPEGGG